MDDLISRQAAIDAIKTWGLIDGLSEGQAIEILADEEKLPTAQPEILACGKGELNVPGTNVGDMISRQAAIDALTHEWDGMVTSVFDVIKSLPSAQPRWIPVTERLPKENGMYLVTMTEKAKAEELGFDLDEIEVSKMRYNSNGWQLPRHIPSWINEVVKDEVIAWMPLPEPYREEEQDE